MCPHCGSNGYDRMQMLIEHSKKSIPWAQCCLAERYARGLLVDVNMRESVKFLKLSAEQGFAKAQFDLALKYDNGEEGTIKNLKRAVQLYSEAADQGYAKAMWNLAIKYDKGEGVKRNKAMAVKLYVGAADAGERDAQCSVGNMFYEGSTLPKSLQKALHYLQLAAKQDSIKAFFSLGCIYETLTNDKQAMMYYRYAADRGSIEALNNLPKVLRRLVVNHSDEDFLFEAIYYTQLYLNECNPAKQQLDSTITVLKLLKSVCAGCAIPLNKAGVASLLLCGKCQCVTYCNKGCQAAHWKAAHRAVCKYPKLL
jgi:TPR repeat protein